MSPTLLDVETIFGMSVSRVEAPVFNDTLISHWNLLWITKT
jgi:hypothetical protein